MFATERTTTESERDLEIWDADSQRDAHVGSKMLCGSFMSEGEENLAGVQHLVPVCVGGSSTQWQDVNRDVPHYHERLGVANYIWTPVMPLRGLICEAQHYFHKLTAGVKIREESFSGSSSFTNHIGLL